MGKSTTLRMILGLEDIYSGKLYIDDKLVNDVAPKIETLQWYSRLCFISSYDCI